MSVCLKASFIVPWTIELPGKDRKDLAVRAMCSQWFSGPRHGDLGQTMHCDSFPKKEREEEENMEKKQLCD